MGSEHTATFVAAPLRDNFYQTSAFIPMSFALVTTVHEDGSTGIGPHALCFPFGVSAPYSMLLISRSSSATAGNLRRTGRCALNYLQYDREQLAAIARLGLPGQALADKQRDLPFALVPSPDPARGDDPASPRIIAEAFQVMECSWDRSYDLDRATPGDDAHAARFVLTIDRLWLKPAWSESPADGAGFPAMPVFLGFRNPGDFWFAAPGEPFAVPLPRVPGLEGQGIFYLANRLDGTVRFTRDACEALTGIPPPFVRSALLGIIASARAAGVTTVDPDFLRSVRTGGRT